MLKLMSMSGVQVSQDRTCRALGIAGKGDVTGADVAGLSSAGRCEVVRDYCADNVRRQREIFERLVAVHVFDKDGVFYVKSYTATPFANLLRDHIALAAACDAERDDNCNSD